VTSFQSSIPSLSRTFHQSRLYRAEEQKSETETTSSGSASQSATSSDIDAVSESSGTTSEPLGQSEHQTESKVESQTESISEKASELAQKAQETVSDVAAKAAQAVGEFSPSTDKVQETASEVTEKAQATASQAAETVQQTASSVSRKTRDAVDANSPFKSQDPSAPAPPTKILYVGNLFFEVTAPQLEAEFAKFGEVTNSRVVTDNRGLSKGFAYLEFANQEAANDALNALDQKVFQGRRLSVQFHKRRAPAGRENRTTQASATPSKTLFIGNMSYQMSDKDLNGKL